MAGAQDGTLANFLGPTEVCKQLAFVPLVLDSWGIKMWESHLCFFKGVRGWGTRMDGSGEMEIPIAVNFYIHTPE